MLRPSRRALRALLRMRYFLDSKTKNLILRRPRSAVSKDAPAHPKRPYGGSALGFETKRIGSARDAIAPDGSEVRVLSQMSRGGLAIFSLPPNAVSKAVAHGTVE